MTRDYSASLHYMNYKHWSGLVQQSLWIDKFTATSLNMELEVIKNWNIHHGITACFSSSLNLCNRTAIGSILCIRLLLQLSTSVNGIFLQRARYKTGKHPGVLPKAVFTGGGCGRGVDPSRRGGSAPINFFKLKASYWILVHFIAIYVDCKKRSSPRICVCNILNKHNLDKCCWNNMIKSNHKSMSDVFSCVKSIRPTGLMKLMSIENLV